MAKPMPEGWPFNLPTPAALDFLEEALAEHDRQPLVGIDEAFDSLLLMDDAGRGALSWPTDNPQAAVLVRNQPRPFTIDLYETTNEVRRTMMMLNATELLVYYEAYPGRPLRRHPPRRR